MQDQHGQGTTRRVRLSARTLRRRRVMAGALAAVGLTGAGLGVTALTGPDLPLPDPPGPADGDDRPRAVTALLDNLVDVSSHVPQASAATLPGLSGASVTVPRTPSAPGLDAAIAMTSAKLLRERLFRGDGATLQVSGRAVASSPQLLGVLLDVVEEHGPSTSLLWYRAEGDLAMTSTGLVAAERWADLVTAVTDLAEQERGVDAAEVAALLREQPRPWGNGPSLLPQADGSLSVLLPMVRQGRRERELLLTVPAATARDLLSEEGHLAAQALASPADHDPARVTVPDPDEARSTERLTTGGPARSASAAGPRTQLAPLAPEGERPSPVTAPDARLLRVVALTFDDGPSEKLNATLRSHLREARAAATFFMIGRSAAAAPALVAATAADGQEIGGHSWDHHQLTHADDAHLGRELSRTDAVIEQATGRPPGLVRPPYGARSARTDAAAGRAGEAVALWDVDTLDWKTLDTQKTIDAVHADARRGSVILMHEIHETSVAAVPQVIRALGSAGLTLLTCQELGQNRLHPGQRMSRGVERDVSQKDTATTATPTALRHR